MFEFLTKKEEGITDKKNLWTLFWRSFMFGFFYGGSLRPHRFEGWRGNKSRIPNLLTSLIQTPLSFSLSTIGCPLPV